MRGRFSYSIASLTPAERKAAATFFAIPPEATYDDVFFWIFYFLIDN